MNYYERHIGDYLKDTSHLSLLEHGVYTRLMDVYYTREGAIPAADVARLVGAKSKDERAALTLVLGEFFCLMDNRHFQDRCDREIARFQDKQRKAKASADARWAHTERNTNASPDAMRTHSEGNATRARPQTPVTSNQTNTKARATSSPPPSARALDSENRSPGTPAGAVCKALRAAGMPDVSPGHPELLAMLEQGVTLAMFESAAAKAVEKRKGFAYMLGIVKSQLQDAAAIAEGPGVSVAPWDSTRSGIEAMAEKVGIGRWDESALIAGNGEVWPAYLARVRAAVEARAEPQTEAI